MNRRGFLGLLGGLGAATATSYFFAPIGGWKSDVIAQPYPAFPPKSELDRALAVMDAHWGAVREEHARAVQDEETTHYPFVTWDAPHDMIEIPVRWEVIPMADARRFFRGSA